MFLDSLKFQAVFENFKKPAKPVLYAFQNPKRPPKRTSTSKASQKCKWLQKQSFSKTVSQNGALSSSANNIFQGLVFTSGRVDCSTAPYTNSTDGLPSPHLNYTGIYVL